MLVQSTVAAGLVGALVRATSGGALTQVPPISSVQPGPGVLAPHLDLHEDPHVPRQGSAPFDDEGVVTRSRDVVSAGVLRATSVELLGAQARHAHHRARRRLANLRPASRLVSRSGDDLDAMLKKLDRGLFVIELMGRA